ncbi:hypothetical protein VTJ83DRAFT_765 [Remersonia thermophila]|uniref:G-protein coupled receptors family 2 profile 2 domain-containing protein n=1 Tax=Remersonia thermophila TaxID=72144 RepID=A0ABR4DPE9_9PEZI
MLSKTNGIDAPPLRGGSTQDLTIEQRDTIERIERLGASISVIGVCLIFAAYGLFKRARTLPNTFIFFASIANLGASIACLIGYAGLAAGLDSALCQAQAFLLEMFMQSDPWWSFAMAANVYMVFFMNYPTSYFHRHLWLYCLVCFGGPAVPALICLLYAPKGKRIYGHAQLWCWIDDDYNQLRILTYYLPIWLCILLSSAIYLAVGCRVFRQRSQLRNLTFSNQGNETFIDEIGIHEKGGQAYGIVTTDIRVTAEPSASPTPPSTPSGSIEPVLRQPAPLSPVHNVWGSPDDEDGEPTTSSLSKNNQSSPHYFQHPEVTVTSIISSAGAASFAGPQGLHDPDSGRVWRGTQLFTLSTPNPRGPEPPASSNCNFLLPVARSWRRFRAKLANLDPVKLGYLRTSFLFALSIFVTWTPSSINRVYALVYPDRPASYPLNLAGAVVLPLQGLWNAVIFGATTWTTLKEEVAALVASIGGMKSRASDLAGEGSAGPFGPLGGRGPGGGNEDGRIEGQHGRTLEPPVSPLSPVKLGWAGVREVRNLPSPHSPYSPRASMRNVRVIKGGSL